MPKRPLIKTSGWRGGLWTDEPHWVEDGERHQPAAHSRLRFRLLEAASAEGARDPVGLGLAVVVGCMLKQTDPDGFLFDAPLEPRRACLRRWGTFVCKIFWCLDETRFKWFELRPGGPSLFIGN